VTKWLAKGDTVSMLDTMQRHGGVSFCRARITDEQNMLDIQRLGIICIIHATLLRQGAKDLSVYIKANIEGTRAVIDTAIAAGISGLVYTSSTSIVFIGTDIVNINKQVPYPEKPFDTYNDAQGMFGVGKVQVAGSRHNSSHGTVNDRGLCVQGMRIPHIGSRDSQVISDNNNLFDYTYVGSITSAHRLIGNKLIPPPSYSSTTSSKPNLDLESATVRSNESLHHAPLPICATTEYHCMMHSSLQTLGPYVTPPPNAESILSTFNTPFNPCEPTGFAVCSRRDGQVFFITNGEAFGILDFTGVHDEYE
ncbi:hypothetical protein BKA82DRAFT_3983817, partial [Pisolithus tinctorius]